MNDGTSGVDGRTTGRIREDYEGVYIQLDWALFELLKFVAQDEGFARRLEEISPYGPKNPGKGEKGC